MTILSHTRKGSVSDSADNLSRRTRIPHGTVRNCPDKTKSLCHQKDTRIKYFAPECYETRRGIIIGFVCSDKSEYGKQCTLPFCLRA